MLADCDARMAAGAPRPAVLTGGVGRLETLGGRGSTRRFTHSGTSATTLRGSLRLKGKHLERRILALGGQPAVAKFQPGLHGHRCRRAVCRAALREEWSW